MTIAAKLTIVSSQRFMMNSSTPTSVELLDGNSARIGHVAVCTPWARGRGHVLRPCCLAAAIARIGVRLHTAGFRCIWTLSTEHRGIALPALRPPEQPEAEMNTPPASSRRLPVTAECGLVGLAVRLGQSRFTIESQNHVSSRAPRKIKQRPNRRLKAVGFTDPYR